jgi:DNA-binding transcriptional regulator YiaG
MLVHSYKTKINNRLPSPTFIPGNDNKTTSSWGFNNKIADRVRIIISPPNFSNNETSTKQNDAAQIIYIIDQSPRLIEECNKTEINTIPFSEYASLVSTALGLGKSDVARILGISRPTLYSWIKGTSEPRENDHPERLRLLGELTRQICKDTARPLYHRYVEAPLPNQTDSIFTLLQAEQWDSSKISNLLAQARHLTLERDQRLGHDIPVNVSKAKQDNNLIDNSIALNLG